MNQSLGCAIGFLTVASLAAFAQPAEAVRLIVQPFIRAETLFYVRDLRSHSNAAFSADGKLLATSASNRGIVATNVIDVATGLVVWSLEVSLPDEVLAGPVFDRKGNVLIAGSTGDVYTWDLVSGKAAQKTIPTLGTITAMTLSSDATTLLAASQSAAGATVRLLDPATLTERSRFAVPAESPKEWIKFAEFGGDTALLVLGEPGGDDKYQIWSLRDKQKIRALAAVKAHLSPDGLRLAVSQPTGAAIVNSRTGVTEQPIPFDRWDSETVAVFSPDSKRVVRSVDSGAELLLFTAGRPQPLHLQQQERGFCGGLRLLEPIVFSPDGRWILANHKSSGCQVAMLWDAESGIKLRTFSDLVPHQQNVAFAQHGPTLLAGAEDRSAVWDMAMGRIRASFPSADDFGPPARMSLFTPDGRRVIVRPTGSYVNQVEVRDAETGACIAKLPNEPDPTTLQAISPDGNTLVALTRGRNGQMVNGHVAEIRLWDLAKMTFTFAVPMDQFRVSGVALSPEGHRLMAGYHLWDLDQKTELWQVPGASSPVDQLGSNPSRIMREFFLDEKRVCLIVQGPPMRAHVWDLDARKELSTYTVASEIAVPSPDRKVLYMAAGGSVAVLDLLTGKEVRRFEPATSLTSDLSVSEDGKWLAAATSEGTRLWDVASGRLKATLVSFLDGTWAVVDPEGHYDASDPDHSPGLHFAAGLEPIELRQLKQRFYAPDLLGRVIRGERLPDVSGKLQQLSLYPEVTVTGPAGGKLQIALKNRGGGLGRVVVKVNGRELSPDARPKNWNPNAPSASFSVDLVGATLDAGGKNKIEVSAYDAGAVVSSRGVSVVYSTPAAAPDVKPRLFAIVSGVSEFAGGGMNLGFAAKDAEDMAAALRAGASRLFGAENVFMQVLSTTGHAGTLPPTKANFQKAFEDVAQKAKSTDVLVVYLAGHGMSAPGVEDVYYYLTQEARSGDIHDRAVRDIATVSSEELKTWCMRIKTVRQVIALDTCAAGAANQQLLQLSEKRALSADQMRAIELFKDSVGSFILMGSAADSVSYEANKYGQGLVTYALLKGMKGESLEEGQRLDVNKWFAYAQREVETLAKDIGGIQRPILSAPNSVSFPIAMLTDEDKRNIKLASVKPQLLRIICNDENDLDPLKLTALTREKLRNLAFLTARGGSGGQEAPFVYLDAVTDDLPGAVIPKVRYQRSGNLLLVRITLVKDGKPLGAVQTLTAPSADAEKARDLIVDAITQALKGAR